MARFETTDDGEVEWHAAKRAGETTVARRLVEPASRAFVGVNVRSDVLSGEGSALNDDAEISLHVLEKCFSRKPSTCHAPKASNRHF
jgi:hypothetical protein